MQNFYYPRLFRYIVNPVAPSLLLYSYICPRNNKSTRGESRWLSGGRPAYRLNRLPTGRHTKFNSQSL